MWITTNIASKRNLQQQNPHTECMLFLIVSEVYAYIQETMYVSEKVVALLSYRNLYIKSKYS